MSIEALLEKFASISGHPKAQLKKYKAEGKKVIGVLPYYAPEELVDAAGMVPMGIWGANDQTISMAKEYCATFYCTIAQLGLEMLLNGTLDELDGVITPTVCDTLRPMSQNIRVAMGHKMPTIFLAHPQNRFEEWGLQFTMDQYLEVKRQLEKIASKAITPEALQSEYVPLIEELNAELEKLPAAKWTGSKVVTSGIICDNPKLLQIFEDNHIAIAADDVAHESRFFKTDAPETDDPMRDLAVQFANRDHDILLYDPQSAKNRRGEFVADLVKNSGAQGLVLFMQQFCDPEEMEYPYLKKALDDAGIPHIKLGIDQQMRDFGQAQTAIQAFADVLSL